MAETEAPMKTETPPREHQPLHAFRIKFCPGCGRNDLHAPLSRRHFSGGKLCHGKPITVIYRREDKD